MSAFSTENKSEVVVDNGFVPSVWKDVMKINGGKRGLCKDQDLVYFGECEDYKWGVLLDGHGGNHFKYVLQRQNWEKIMKQERPDLELIRLIKLEPFEHGNTSGSTMSMMKIYGDRIETYNIGDSHTIIYKNGEMVYMNSPHNSNNPVERARLEAMGCVTFDPCEHQVPYMLDSETMGFKSGEYSLFKDGTRLTPSQSLGHNGITGYNTDIHIEPYCSTDIIRCICCSDGVTDMVLFSSENEADVKKDDYDMQNMSVDEILDKSEKRWKQSWRMLDTLTGKYINNAYPPDMYDDVSVIMFEKLFIDTLLEKV